MEFFILLLVLGLLSGMVFTFVKAARSFLWNKKSALWKRKSPN